jgi:transmembrane sensor
MIATDKVRSSIAEEAAEWFVANRSGLADSVQRDAFVAWLRSSPLHVEEYLGIALIVRDLPQAAADPETPLEVLVARARGADAAVRTLTSGTRGLPRQNFRRGWRLISLAIAGAAAALATAALTFFWRTGDHATVVHYATRHGEQITQRLADNSVLRLDTETAVTVRYGRSQRLVEVERGQVLFEVAHEPRWPFRVVAGFAEMRAVGTKFNVYRRPDSTIVTVLEGQLNVGLAPGQPGAAAAGDRTVAVHAGEQVQVAQGTLLTTAASADTRRSTAWLRREIVFEQEPLAAVAAEFNRYSAIPIEIDTPELRSLAISGVLSGDDTESLVAFLRSLDGVKVEVTRTRIRVSRN